MVQATVTDSNSLFTGSVEPTDPIFMLGTKGELIDYVGQGFCVSRGCITLSTFMIVSPGWYEFGKFLNSYSQGKETFYNLERQLCTLIICIIELVFKVNIQNSTAMHPEGVWSRVIWVEDYWSWRGLLCLESLCHPLSFDLNHKGGQSISGRARFCVCKACVIPSTFNIFPPDWQWSLKAGGQMDKCFYGKNNRICKACIIPSTFNLTCNDLSRLVVIG